MASFRSARTALRVTESYARLGDAASARPLAQGVLAFFRRADVPALAERAAAITH